jgi:hypothetical protein
MPAWEFDRSVTAMNKVSSARPMARGGVNL